MLAHITTPVVTSTPDPVAIPIAILTSGVGALIVATMLADRGGLLPKSTIAFGQWTATVATALSLGAAAIHFAVIGEHFAEYPPYGIAFTALAWFQVGWAVGWVIERRRPVALAAIAVNGGALAVWAISRTAGLPIGPEPGELEPVGPLDLLSGVLECGLIGLLAWDLGISTLRFRPGLPIAGATVVVGSVALTVVVATSVAFAANGTDEHHHGDAVEEVVGVDPGPSDGEGLVSEPPSAQRSTVVPSPAPSVPSPAPSAAAATAVTAAASLAGSASSPGATRAPPSPETPARTTQPARSPAPTVRPPSPRPTAAPVTHPGVIQFGSALDPGGQITQSDNRFSEGETAVWIADFRDAPAVPEILKLIIQVLPDGREFEHWREQVPLSDPTATRLVGHAELSLYAHGGVGSYRLRYMRGDELLAEGTFELVP